MSDYLNEQAQKFFIEPILLADPAKTIEITDLNGDILGLLEDTGGDYQVRVDGVFKGLIEKSSALEPYKLELTGIERNVLIDALRATVGQLDEIMQKGMGSGSSYDDLREVADASNALEDILVKLAEYKDDSN